MSVDVEVLIEHAGWTELDLETLAASAARATLARLGIGGPAAVVVLATSDAAVAALNAQFRDKPVPTNVLSWPAQSLAPDAPGQAPQPPARDPTGALELGDIALAYETCAREAKAAGKPLKDHATHLIVHAILHLAGYDHISDEDAALMERLEAEILSTLGLPDPYTISG
ncbi:MAG: rRNA maturation RNase YbeY [Pseudomonadota bacterium]